MKTLFIITVLFLAGCSQPHVVIHPITNTDIVAVKQGQTFEAPKDGFFLSADYVREVMQAKVRE